MAIEHRDAKPVDPEMVAVLEEIGDKNAAGYRLLLRFNTASAEGLARFADIVHRLSDQDLERMARFGEALADWPVDDVGSTDDAEGES